MATVYNYQVYSRTKITRYEGWYGEKPDLGYLRVIGSKAYYLLSPASRLGKLELPIERGILLGYKGTSSYVILNAKGRVFETNNVVFDEGATALLRKRLVEEAN